MNCNHLAPGIFTVNQVLNPAECESMIARAHAQGFEAATITTTAGPSVDADTRNNERAILDDRELTQKIWGRVGKFVPPLLLGRQARGLNERVRFYRYKPGQKFAWHQDAPFRRDNGETSLLTFMIYLNDGYQGGGTRFESLVVQGHIGMALVFTHELLHEGEEVTSGVKYVLRSDVLYGPVGQFSSL